MYRIVFLLFIHTGADFILQGDKMSKLKAEKFIYLLAHVAIYTVAFIVLSPLALNLTFMQGLVFSLINGAAHLAVDFVTSNLKMKYWEESQGKYIAVVSVDHFLHVAILIATYIFMYPQALVVAPGVGF